MKPSFLFIAALALGQQLVAQQAAFSSPRTKTYVHTNPAQRSGSPVIAPSSTIIYSQDFATGMPANWTVTDNAGNGEVWTYTTTGTSAGGALNPTGTSAANGYVMFDSDGGGSSSPAEDCALTSNAINCTGNPQVFLSFNEMYVEYLNDSSIVSVSNDGIMWTNYYCPDTVVDPATFATPNPNHVVLDISATAGNQATVYVRFHYQGDYDWFWLVDDVTLYVPDAQDGAAAAVNPLVQGYTRIPRAQAVNLSLMGEVRNLGGTAMTGASAVFTVIDTVSGAVVFTSTTSIPTLAPLAQATVTSASSFTASANGYYRTRLHVTGVTGDAVATNDTAAAFGVVYVNDSVFARDVNAPNGTLGIGAGPAQGIVGQNFMLTNSDVLTSVSFYLDEMSPNPAGSPVYVTIHPQSIASAPGAAIGTTDSLMIMPNMIPSGGAWYTVPVSGGSLWMNAGMYYFGVHEEDSLLPLATSPGIISANAVWVSWNTIPSPPAVNGWASAEDFGFQIVYMLRPNFGPVVSGVNEAQHNVFSAYPNPANDAITLSFANAETRVITVFNTLGEVVTEFTSANNLVNINTANLAAGTYTVRVSGASGNSMQNISVAH
jgi:hypothetical protein